MRKKLLILAVSLVLILSGCGAKQGVPERQAPEVLLAQECGFDKLPCCSSDPVCNFEQQCCVDPNDHNRNYCSDSCSCGHSEEFCCEGEKCSNGLTCHGGICLECGSEGDVCCPGEAACLAGLACLEDECVQCGLAGHPCCAGAEPCLFEKGARSECFRDLCRNCGFDGNAACQDEPYCQEGQILTGGRCERCGDLAKPCCNIGSGRDFECDPKKGLVCELGFCSEQQ